MAKTSGLTLNYIHSIPNELGEHLLKLHFRKLSVVVAFVMVLDICGDQESVLWIKTPK